MVQLSLFRTRNGGMGRESKSHKKTDKVRRVYFNNHYRGKAVIIAMQFKDMIGKALAADERKVLEHA